MDIVLFIKSLEAIFEVLFLGLSLYYLIRGIKTRNFGKASIFFFSYLALNIIRRVIGY